MTTRAEIIAEARSWSGTPHVHQGRLKGIACDCAGLIVQVPIACGLFPTDFEITKYSAHPDPTLMGKVLKQFLDPVNRPKKGGDVLFLRPRHLPQHTAIYTFDNTIIHAIDRKRGVREHILDKRWSDAIVAVYTYRNLDD